MRTCPLPPSFPRLAKRRVNDYSNHLDLHSENRNLKREISRFSFLSLSFSSCGKITSSHDKEAQGSKSVFYSLIWALQEWVDASCTRQRARSALFMVSESLFSNRFDRKYLTSPLPRVPVYRAWGVQPPINIYIAGETNGRPHTR